MVTSLVPVATSFNDTTIQSSLHLEGPCPGFRHQLFVGRRNCSELAATEYRDQPEIKADTPRELTFDRRQFVLEMTFRTNERFDRA